MTNELEIKVVMRHDKASVKNVPKDRRKSSVTGPLMVHFLVKSGVMVLRDTYRLSGGACCG